MITVQDAPHVIVASVAHNDRMGRPTETVLATAVLNAFGWSLTYRERAGRGRLRQVVVADRDVARASVLRTAQLRIGALPSDSSALAPPGG